MPTNSAMAVPAARPRDRATVATFDEVRRYPRTSRAVAGPCDTDFRMSGFVVSGDEAWPAPKPVAPKNEVG
jgi:hypothetical protein